MRDLLAKVDDLLAAANAAATEDERRRLLQEAGREASAVSRDNRRDAPRFITKAELLERRYDDDWWRDVPEEGWTHPWSKQHFTKEELLKRLREVWETNRARRARCNIRSLSTSASRSCDVS
jgi:hypothetical protein